MRRRNGNIQSLTVVDLDDRSLLAIVDDEADGDGWASTDNIADKVFGAGGSVNRRLHAVRCVGIRFAWLKRYGVVERHKTDPAWRLTDVGEALLFGSRKTDRIVQQVNGALDEDLLHVAMEVGDRYRSASSVAQTMVRRAFSYSVGRR